METRTPDLLITNQLLYQLSYAGNCVERLDTRGFPGRQGVLLTCQNCSLRVTFDPALRSIGACSPDTAAAR